MDILLSFLKTNAHKQNTARLKNILPPPPHHHNLS